MINAETAEQEGGVLLLAPEGDTAAVALLAETLRAREVPVRTLTVADAGRWRQWRDARAALRETAARRIISFCESGHVLSALLGGADMRRIFLQVIPPQVAHTAAARLFWRLLPWLARRGTLAAPTRRLRETLAKRAGLPPGAVLHLPLPVALPDPLPSVGDLRAREPLVLFAGPLKRAHQPGLALKALRHLPQEVRLVLSGDGESARAVRHMVEKLGLAERVRLLAPGEDWRAWLDRARVACLPARFAPWAPEAVLALAHGLPLIGTDAPGLHELLADNPARGEMVDLTDEHALAAALARWLETPGDAAPRQALARRYAPEAVAERWREALRINP